MGYTKNCEIWHGASLGIMIMIQKEPIWRTMWGPSFGHERVISWPFLGKRGYGIHPELWNLTWGIPSHINYDSGKTMWRNMWGPCFGHKRAIFWPFLGVGYYGIHPELWNLVWIVPGNIDYDSGRTHLKDYLRTIGGPCFGHKLAIFWPFVGKGVTG